MLLRNQTGATGSGEWTTTPFALTLNNTFLFIHILFSYSLKPARYSIVCGALCLRLFQKNVVTDHYKLNYFLIISACINYVYPRVIEKDQLVFLFAHLRAQHNILLQTAGSRF